MVASMRGQHLCRAMKRIVKQSCGRIFQHLLSLRPKRDNIHLILMYHRVLERVPRGLYDPGLFVTASTFEMHLNEIARWFDIVPLEQALQNKEERGRLCTITFDDGWIDNYQTAFPILKEHHVPATIFVPVKLVGSDHFFWWESLFHLANRAVESRAEQAFVGHFHDLVPLWNPPLLSQNSLGSLAAELKALPAGRLDDLMREAHTVLHISPPSQRTIINWSQIREMGQCGITFGSHGLRHYILTTLDNRMKKEEILRSRELLENRGIPTVPFFSFPNGDWDQESVALMSMAGYRGGLTTRDGYNDHDSDPFLLNRVGLHECISATPDLFWFRILQSIVAGSNSGL
jgi:peptidoglycan/xylan/chitin deacetylase (PgdA/CDA1 family)